MLRFLTYRPLTAIIAGSLFCLMSCKNDYSTDDATLAKGKKLFVKHCSACHGLQEDGIGPPLGGVTNLLTERALIEFVKNPSKIIDAGDQRAVKLFSRYKQRMPSYEHLEDTEINSILSYINDETQRHHLKSLEVGKDTSTIGLTGRLVAPVEPSGLKVELEEYIQIQRTEGSSLQLGVATLRVHPSGDGTLFASDQNGILYVIKDGQAEVFLDVSEHVADYQHGPGLATGLGSFDFHPDYLNNGLIYAFHAETYKGQSADYAVYADTLKSEVQWVLSEWKMEDVNDPVFNGTRREMLRTHAPTFAHGVQDLGFVPGLDKGDPEYGLLYFGYGDGGTNNISRPELGHHLQSFLGSIFRIDPRGNNSKNGNYGIPTDNPFVNEADPLTVKEIYAYGFRNPHRMAWDETNENRLMVTDIGEANIEEINIIEKGGDYGWPNREGVYGISTTIDKKVVHKLEEGHVDIFKRPFAQYDHEEGNAISGGYVYDGDLALLKKKYVFGDIVNGKLFYTNVDAELSDSTVYELTIVENDGKETSLREMSNEKRMHMRVSYDRLAKQLYVITKVDGKIFRVSQVYK